MTKGELAKQYFLRGHNCAQAVALAFCEETGMKERPLTRVTIGLGGGLGRLRETCGAVSAGAVVLGLCFPDKSKSEIYALVQQLAKSFKEENGSYNCGELLSGAGIATDTSPNAQLRTAAFYRKRPCADLVACAADLLAALILENE